MTSWFKEKEILETIYFRDLQEKIGSLLYFIPATLLFGLLLYFSLEEPINTGLCLIGVGVSLLELRRLRSNELILSDRIARVKPFFTIMKDQETRIWQFQRVGAESTLRELRTDLIKRVFEALASKN